MDLNAELFRQLSIIAEDEGLMKKAVNALKRITGNGKTKTDETWENIGIPCSIEEVKKVIDEFETSLEAGTLDTTSHDTVMNEMRDIIAAS